MTASQNIQLRAGVARVDITPPMGIAHANWGAQTHQRAAGVDLPLWATALALSDGDETVVIVDVDVLYLWKNEAARALDAVSTLTGLPKSHIRLSWTHTHSGPTIGSDWTAWTSEGGEMVAPYTENLIQQIAGVAWKALQNLRPARVSAGLGRCKIGVNRRLQRPEDGAVIVGRYWDGLVDESVHVIRIDAIKPSPPAPLPQGEGRKPENGEGEKIHDERGLVPLATIVNYACHPITVGPDCQLITPDYPGMMKRVVEEATGSTCLFLQGATGDIGPIRGVARDGLHEYKRLGRILGHEASKVWWEIELRPARAEYLGTLESGAPLAIYDDNPHPTGRGEKTEETAQQYASQKLRVKIQPMKLPLRALPSPEEFEVELEKNVARLNELRVGGGSEEDIRWQTMLSKRAAMRADLAREYRGQTHHTYDLQIFTIGDDIALVAMPGEPFVEIGMRIKERTPFMHTLFSGYSNVGWAYIPTPQAYELGGYEVEVTPFEPDASLQIVDETLAALGAMKKKLP